MKYIRTKKHGIIVFPEELIHREVAANLGYDLKYGLVSAGFVRLFLDENLYVECYGTSESLRLDSRPLEDSDLLTNQMILELHRDPAFQEKIRVLMKRCFGEPNAMDLQELNRRFIIEALELVQACEFSREAAHVMVDYVYGRAIGDKAQEVGGVEIMLSALCNAHGIGQDQARDNEYRRGKAFFT